MDGGQICFGTFAPVEGSSVAQQPTRNGGGDHLLRGTQHQQFQTRLMEPWNPGSMKALSRFRTTAWQPGQTVRMSVGNNSQGLQDSNRSRLRNSCLSAFFPLPPGLQDNPIHTS